MCGISGVFATHIESAHQKIIEDIVKDQYARGPDHSAIKLLQGQNCQALFGHNRLSIIDLSADGNQPMWDPTGRYCITYNGEIYNYLELKTELSAHNIKFNTASDTEVILNSFAHWGIHALSRFNGPFACAIFDKQTGEMYLCRDRFGVRPLYYLEVGSQLYFASSVRVLALTFSLQPDLAYIARGLKYLVYESGNDESPFVGIKSLPAASYIQVKYSVNNALSCVLQKYYNLSDQVDCMIHNLPADDPSYLLQLTAERFEQAVALRLRSDVPLGITLSSGLDSSAVAAEVSRQHPDTIGFSYGHPADKYSEGKLAKQCADMLGIKIDFVAPDSAELIAGLFKTIEVQETPFASLSVVAQYLLYQRIKSSGIKVILGGQGGDEVFMGYRKYIVFWLQHLLRQKKTFSACKNFFAFLPLFFSEIQSAKIYWQNRHRYLSNSKTQSVLRLPEALTLNLAHEHSMRLSDRQLKDIQQFSLPTLLRYEDRNAMGNSVESRLPFLDYRLLELGTALPAALKLRAGFAKWPIRHIMQNRIPDAIRLAHYKRGFDLPMAALIAAGLGKAIRTALQEKAYILREYLKPNISVAADFSDAALLKRPKALAEVITLLWLGRFVQ